MIKILICGDYCPQDRVQDLIEKENYERVFGEICRYISNVDYSIVNLEAPVVESEIVPIKKCGPNLKCSSKAISALRYAGFNMVTLANNHFYDFGDAGVLDTLTTCKKNGLDTVGGGINLKEASHILYVDIKGLKFAFINCCEHEFSIAEETSGGSNPLNPIQQYYVLQEAKKYADRIIVIVHGGHEHCQLPSPRMKEIYRFFIDTGADVVINHHQHCYSGYEVYKRKPIFYGLGNFCFNRDNNKNHFWNEGYMVELKFEEDQVGFNIIPYLQGLENPGVLLIKDETLLKNFNSSIACLNEIISNDEKLCQLHKEWMKNKSKYFKLALEPYSGRVFSSLYMRNLLPSFMTEKKILKILNYIQCESHLDRLRFIIKENLNNSQ